MKPSRRFLFVPGLLCLIVVGCATDPTPSPTAAPTPTQAPIPTPTPHPLPGDTHTRATDGMVMVFVPAGTFRMGSTADELALGQELCAAYEGLINCANVPFEREQPERQVTLDAFWIDQTEVTNAQYAACMAAGVCTEQACTEEPPIEAAMLWEAGRFDAPQQPVVCVNWEQAGAYCAWVGGRLPSEAEWEYAARGPESLDYPWGESFDPERLNACDANCLLERASAVADDGYAYPAPVGSYPTGASWVGALDMAGNVWEWVIDWYGNFLPGDEVNPPGPASGDIRVARGGAWASTSYAARSAYRGWGAPAKASSVAGFRCVVATQP